MDTAIVVITRDLRVHDNPALTLACAAARQVVPVFVADPAPAVPPNRGRFLAQSVGSLRKQLRRRGGDLVIQHGEQVVAALPRLIHACVFGIRNGPVLRVPAAA